jgi:hypothetical protein
LDEDGVDHRLVLGGFRVKCSILTISITYLVIELATQLIRVLCDFTDPGEVVCSSCSLAGVFGSQSSLVSRIFSSAHRSGFVVCGGAWVTSHALAAWYTHWHSSEVKRVDMNWWQSSQLGWWLCMMLVRALLQPVVPLSMLGCAATSSGGLW